MSIIYFLIPLSIAAAAVFLMGFVWAVCAGQYEDTCTPAMRLLMEDSNDAAAGHSETHDFKTAQPDVAKALELELQPTIGQKK